MKMDNSPLMDHFGYLASQRLDIQDLIDKSRNFIFIAQPFFTSAKAIISFFRWESQTTTLIVLALFNVFGLFISKSGLFMIIVFTFSVLISLGFFHRQYKIFIKVIPSIDPDAPYNCKSHTENMRDFRLLLSALEGLIMLLSDGLLKTYSIFTWDDLRFSLKSHIILACSLLLLLFAPFRYFLLFVFNLSVILGRPVHCDDPDSSHMPSSANETPETESLPIINGSQIPASTAATVIGTMPPPIATNPDESEITSDVSDQVDVCYATDSDCSEKLADDLNSDEDSALLNDIVNGTNKNPQQQQQKHQQYQKLQQQVNLLPAAQSLPQIKEQPLKPSIMDGVSYKQLTESQELSTSLPTTTSSSSSPPLTTPLTTSSTILPTSSTTTATTASTGNKISLNQKVPNLVDKFMELKNKAKNMPMEKCKSCGAIFTAILKRRHICNCCGNHYCSRCCSHKVPRSRFGATAPAAQTETVAVCTGCLHKLIEQRKEKIT